mmetsp:Transcript_99854/g.222959  ORF Transcript_99854/g.222959 Transcript_99854/m.222959 type:complete len:202 (+) Transcript_99854:53-658(+)
MSAVSRAAPPMAPGSARPASRDLAKPRVLGETSVVPPAPARAKQSRGGSPRLLAAFGSARASRSSAARAAPSSPLPDAGLAASSSSRSRSRAQLGSRAAAPRGALSRPLPATSASPVASAGAWIWAAVPGSSGSGAPRAQRCSGVLPSSSQVCTRRNTAAPPSSPSATSWRISRASPRSWNSAACCSASSRVRPSSSSSPA